MRRAPLIILSVALIAAAVLVGEVPLNTAAIQLPNRYRVMLVESIVLIERPGHLSTSVPLCIIGFGLAAVAVACCLVAMLTERNRARGFEVTANPHNPFADGTG